MMMAAPRPPRQPMPRDTHRPSCGEDLACQPGVGDGVRQWQSALVYGLGLSGIAVARLLLAAGVRVRAIDDAGSIDLPRDLEENGRFEFLRMEQLGPFDSCEVDVVALSPGVPKERDVLDRARAAGCEVLPEAEVAYRLLAKHAPKALDRIVGITGSNGKSTTTQLVADLVGIHAQACGNIGVPLSDCVRSLLPDAALDHPAERDLVVELSSFQLEQIERFRVPAAALLNISPDHLDRHRSAASYVEAKRHIFAQQVAGDLAVLNADDPVVADTKINPGVRRREFSLLGAVVDGCYRDNDRVLLVEPGTQPRQIFSTDDLAIVGDHNLANAMAAVLLALSRGLDPALVPERLRAFRGLPHRTQFVASSGGVSWYDDSKGTNVGATEKSLEGFADGSVHLIAGGRTKGGDFNPLREAVASKVAELYVVGEAAKQMESDLGRLVPVTRSGTIERAVRLAHSRAQPGQVVLLSPACASFDQFADFAERGMAFQREVQLQLDRKSQGAGLENDGTREGDGG